MLYVASVAKEPRELAVKRAIPSALAVTAGVPIVLKERGSQTMTLRKWLPARKWLSVGVCLTAAIALTGCKVSSNKSGTRSESANSASALRGEEQVEKAKPAAGMGNVQGEVFFNSQPVENIEVKLCETFSRFLSGCGGKIHTARTVKGGEFVITNVAPKTYEALTAKVFDTDSYVFATVGFGVSSAKYDVVADKTFFVNPIHLFKSNLKIVNPKAAAKMSPQGWEVKWEPYPEAAYYKFSIFTEGSSVPSPYINKRVEDTSFGLDKALAKGTYRLQVSAFNKDDKKLAESADEIEFSVVE